MSMLRGWRNATAGAVLLLGLGACIAAQPTSFYTLSSEVERQPPPAGRSLVIGLGPITLPPYLDRPDIVTRQGPNEIRLAEFHRWAEPLEPLLARTMAQNLYTLLDAKDVILLPQRRDTPLDRVVEIEVARLDADEAGQVTFDGRWWVYRGDGETLLASGHSEATEHGAPPPDYAAIVAAMSRAVAAVSRDIAGAIRGAPKPAAKGTREPEPRVMRRPTS